ncbi:MAG: hypothetical protein ACREE6_12240, partial [Limisphaerales bacterium]
MKRLLLICMSFLMGLSVQQTVLGKDAPTTAVQLMQEWKSAFEAKDKNAILVLFNWDGVPGWTKASMADDVDDWLTRDLKGVNLAPLPADFRSSGQVGNVRFHLNLRPDGKLEAHFTDG